MGVALVVLDSVVAAMAAGLVAGVDRSPDENGTIRGGSADSLDSRGVTSWSGGVDDPGLRDVAAVEVSSVADDPRC